MSNLYNRFFEPPVPPDASLAAAALAAAHAYLDNKPAGSTVRISRARRDADFWSCPHWATVPIDTWRSEVMTLALARYFAQETAASPELLERLATACPAVLVKAVRHSGLVLTSSPMRRAELTTLGERHPDIAELCRVLFIFTQAHRERLEALEALRAAFARTTPFELLILASLYAFEHLVSRAMAAPHRPDGVQTSDEVAWSALHDVFLWKLAHATPEDFVLDEAVMGRLLARHLAPVLQCMPGREDAGAPVRHRFADLVEAQVELHAFVSQSADAFSYDDGIRFERRGTTLEIVEVDAALRDAWRRDGRKLARLHGYWFYRAADDFVASGMATVKIGRPENQEANQLAYLRALRTRLQLTQVYGIAESVTTDTGEAVDVFQAALSLELMSAFFQRDFLEAFMSHLRRVKDWRVALRLLAEGGARAGLQNRFPLTWSDRAAKIVNITGWTVTQASPTGDARMAAAILDFWSSDWAALSMRLKEEGREGHQGSPGLRPALLERPVLNFGELLVQLPWHVGLQNNTTAAINNLRRLGHQRREAREETQRIEQALGAAFAARGFSVVANWMPDRALHGAAGEVDIIVTLEGVVLVIEVKSTFLRQSQKEAFQHASGTLRNAGRQVNRKVGAVVRELSGGGSLKELLGLADDGSAPEVLGWIVDTSIECDHQHFSGVLKVSLEEILIALRDDVALLWDPDHLFAGGPSGDEASGPAEDSLYPQGFSARRLVEVIAREEVWRGI